jgi:endoglucanase
MKLWKQNFDRVRDHKITCPEVAKIFEHPVAQWYGERKGKKFKNIRNSIERLMRRVPENEIPVLVLYNMPNRDIGKYSKGGAETRQAYLEFVEEFAKGIGGREPILIYEPDSIPHVTLMEPDPAQDRLNLITDALDILKRDCAARVYVDIGHSNWLSPTQAGNLLKRVRAYNHAGFAVNVSNYRSTSECIDWSYEVAEHVPGMHYVIDTSRNGNGPYGNEWCNPPGRALGELPTLDTGVRDCDAFLWIKVPGESDGTCNGGPRAGRYWPEQGRELVRNAGL